MPALDPRITLPVRETMTGRPQSSDTKHKPRTGQRSDTPAPAQDGYSLDGAGYRGITTSQSRAMLTIV